jgi:hypothetical protein
MEEQSREYGQMNITLPHDVVPLPSQGVFYKNKKKSVKVGYLTAADENIIMAGGNETALNLVRAKLYEPDLKPEDMLEGDVESILIFLRNTAFGPELNLTVTDPSTQKQFKVSTRLDELPIINGQEPNADGTFSVTLPKSGMSAKIKPLTYGETTEISRVIESYPQGRVAPRATLRLQKQIVELNGNQDKGYIVTEIEKLPIADSKFIKKFMDENEPRLDLQKIITAPSGEKLTVNVGFGAEFFRPFF